MIIFDLADQRQIGDAGPLTFNEEALQAAAEVSGLNEVSQDDLIEVKVRLRDWNNEAHAKVKGLTPASFRVVLYLLPKAEFSDAALYSINSVLVGMLRHVAQFRFYGSIVMEAKGMPELMKEAQEYGRMAHLSEKGKVLWGIVPPLPEEASSE
jgi:hypothetical protein